MLYPNHYSIIVILLSIGGVPPLIGFSLKILVLYRLLYSSKIVFILGLIVMAIGVYIYFIVRVLYTMTTYSYKYTPVWNLGVVILLTLHVLSLPVLAGRCLMSSFECGFEAAKVVIDIAHVDVFTNRVTIYTFHIGLMQPFDVHSIVNYTNIICN